MIVFTLLGIATYWVAMGCIGYAVGYAANLAWELYSSLRDINKQTDTIIAMVQQMQEQAHERTRPA